VAARASRWGDWIGWLGLKREAVNEDATRNTARVVGDMAADVFALIEVEDRPALQRLGRLPCPWRPSSAEVDNGFVAGAHARVNPDDSRDQRRARGSSAAARLASVARM
jgi:hypothetical protein